MSEHQKPSLGETVWLRVVQLLRFCRGSPHYSEWTRGEFRENKPVCVCVCVWCALCIVQALLAAGGSWKWQFHIFIFDLPIDDNTVDQVLGSRIKVMLAEPSRSTEKEEVDIGRGEA